MVKIERGVNEILMPIVADNLIEMSEKEKITRETKEVRQKMIDVSKYINSNEFQYAKGKEITTTNRELVKKNNVVKKALDSISTKVATKIKELEVEFEKIERLYKIKDTCSYDMWEFYLAEEENKK